MKNKKPILNEILRFLNYLQENDSDKEKLNPIIIFGKEKVDKRTIDLCKEGGYVNGNHNAGWEITIRGIEFFEEHKKTKVKEENTKINSFLTAMLVLTTIAGLFYSTELVGSLTLLLIYGIFSILMLIYFKKAKKIIL